MSRASTDQLILAIDQGTTNSKAALISADGQMVAGGSASVGDLFTASWLGGTGPGADLVERARGGGGLPRECTGRGDCRRRLVNSAGIRRWLASQHRRTARPADRLAGPPHGELVRPGDR